MTHVIRLNVAGIGYDTYVWRGAKLSRAPLGQTPSLGSPAESECLHKVQRRLDNFLHGGTRPWSMAFARVSDDAVLAIGYGGRLDAADDKGRTGVRFTHIVLVKEETTAIRLSLSILSLLSVRHFEGFARRIAAIAVGGETPDTFIPAVIEEIHAKSASFDISPTFGPSPSLRGIVHDTVGAAPVAWMTLLVQQLTERAPWEIHDTVDVEHDQYMTLCSPSEGELVYGSEIILPIALHMRDALTGMARSDSNDEPHVRDVDPSTLPAQQTLLGSLDGSTIDAHEATTDSSLSSEGSRAHSEVRSTPLNTPSLVPIIALAVYACVPLAVILGLVDLSRPIMAGCGIAGLITSILLWHFVPGTPPADNPDSTGTSVINVFSRTGLGVLGLMLLAYSGLTSRQTRDPGETKATLSQAEFSAVAVQPQLEDTVAVLNTARERIRIISDSLQSTEARVNAVRDTLQAVRGVRDSAWAQLARLRRQLSGVRQPNARTGDSARVVPNDTSNQIPTLPTASPQ